MDEKHVPSSIMFCLKNLTEKLFAKQDLMQLNQLFLIDI